MKIVKILFVSVFALLAACANQTAPANQIAANQSAANQPSANAAPPADEFAAARANYEKQRCVVCHKETGEGGKNVAYGDITIDNVPSFKNPKVAAESDAEYVRKIEQGGDGMPKFKNKLSKDEINELVRYVRTFQK